VRRQGFCECEHYGGVKAPCKCEFDNIKAPCERSSASRFLASTSAMALWFPPGVSTIELRILEARRQNIEKQNE